LTLSIKVYNQVGPCNLDSVSIFLLDVIKKKNYAIHEVKGGRIKRERKEDNLEMMSNIPISSRFSSSNNSEFCIQKL
jgi:hypothetical protein